MSRCSDIKALDLALRDNVVTGQVLYATWTRMRMLWGQTLTPVTTMRLHSPGATFSLIGEDWYEYRGDRHGD